MMRWDRYAKNHIHKPYRQQISLTINNKCPALRNVEKNKKNLFENLYLKESWVQKNEIFGRRMKNRST